MHPGKLKKTALLFLLNHSKLRHLEPRSHFNIKTKICFFSFKAGGEGVGLIKFKEHLMICSLKL